MMNQRMRIKMGKIIKEKGKNTNMLTHNNY